ncbi:hypothetical protein [Brevifollis gellanilyticus]|uniref:hypothetical protein n=1 Tax=Brevifollis gellanilyticus TaxID=748831 RepID=UPI0011BF2BD8|nr:hypothetical protein [Brevifollis gellanilyticus]
MKHEVESRIPVDDQPEQEKSNFNTQGDEVNTNLEAIFKGASIVLPSEIIGPPGSPPNEAEALSAQEHLAEQKRKLRECEAIHACEALNRTNQWFSSAHKMWALERP